MPAYNLYVTVDHHGECTKAKAVYTVGGDQSTIYTVTDPWYVSPAEAVTELLVAVDEHRRVVRKERASVTTINRDE